MEQMLGYEFIGCEAAVVDAENRSLIGLEGEIVMETKNSFTIITQKGKKTLLKAHSTFNINGRKIRGRDIMKRPEERIKFM